MSQYGHEEGSNNLRMSQEKQENKKSLRQAMFDETGIDLEAKNTILDYTKWVNEVQRILKDLGIPDGSFYLEPAEDSDNIKSWKSLFNDGCNPGAVAWYIFTIDW